MDLKILAQKKLRLRVHREAPRFWRIRTRDDSRRSAYYRFPKRHAYYGIDSFSADLLAFLEVDTRGEPRGPVRYKWTLTDRRSDAVLGVYTYVVDRFNKRACGANIGNSVSLVAFIHTAIHH